MIPDWVQLAVALGGVAVGIAAAWHLFREQQKTDFNRLERTQARRHTEITKTLAQVHELLGLSDKIDLARDLSAMRAAVENLRDDVRDLTHRILNDIRDRQSQLMGTVAREFRDQVQASEAVVGEALEREITALVAPELQRSARERLLELYLHAMRSVGEYQRKSIDGAFKSSMENLEDSLQSEVNEVAEAVEELGRWLDALPALPPADLSEVEEAGSGNG